MIEIYEKKEWFETPYMFWSIFGEFFFNGSYIFLSKIDAHVPENSPKSLSKALYKGGHAKLVWPPLLMWYFSVTGIAKQNLHKCTCKLGFPYKTN